MLRCHLQNRVIFLRLTSIPWRSKSRFDIIFLVLTWIFLPCLSAHMTGTYACTISTIASLFWNYKTSALLCRNAHATLFAFFILYNVLNLLDLLSNTLVVSEEIGLRHWTIIWRSWVVHLYKRIAGNVLVHLEQFVYLLFETKISENLWIEWREGWLT